jgi:tRNA A-37 threonylcarbamoyl transferase component Bud32
MRDRDKGGGSRIDTLPDGFAERLGARPLGVGDVIGSRYRLVESLGHGGMGQVFVAENVAIGLRVAVKLLKPELLANPEFRQRFQNEAQAVAAIAHPNVARFFDLVVGDPTFIVMEYVRGESLADLIKRDGKLPLARAVAIARRLAWALDAVHGAGVVHRDLKPANVMLAPDAEHGETPKLIDFGLAKLAASVADQGRLTRTGQIIGTPQYMAPEQITGRAIDGRADVYALGCLMYEMLTGVGPFSTGDDVQILYRQIHHKPPPPSSLAPEVPRALDDILAQALEKDPAARPSSMRALAAGLALAVPDVVDVRPAGTSGVRVDATGRVVLPREDSTVPVVTEGTPREHGRLVLVWATVATALLLVAASVAALRWRGRAESAAGALLVITTQPPGARVTLDGHALTEPTPTALRGLGAGPHEVALAHEGFGAVERRVTLEPGGRSALDVTLPPRSRRVDVITVPAGAALWVDGQLAPTPTPTTVTLTDDDFHELRAELAGYESALRAVKPEDREGALTLELTPERRPRGTLVVEAHDVAEVWVDGVSTGLTTPTLGFHVPVGEHAVELRGPGGERSAVRTVKVGRGQTVRVSLSLPQSTKGQP